MTNPVFRASLALALASLPWLAHADEAADLKALRQEVDSLRSQYEARLKTLEDRLRAAEAARAAPAAAVAPAPLPAAPSPVPVAAGPAGGPASGTGFNPALSLILSGLATRTSRDPAGWHVGGQPLPPGSDVGPGSRGFSLSESELGLAANIDPWFSGAANISLHPDNTVSVEEAYVQTGAIGEGLTLKAGRFFSSIGYLNSQHAHTWDFVDTPLAYQAFLGGQYGDDGVQLAWLAPTDTFIELRGELGRGLDFPGSGASRNGAGMAALALHAGGDIGDSSSWRAGLSVLQAHAQDQLLDGTDLAGGTTERSFSGRTRVYVADAVWKWAPGGNATRTNFKLQGEWLRSTREGSLADSASADTGPWRLAQSGGYLQAVYQFMPHWRVGLRGDWMDAARVDGGSGTPLFGAEPWRPRRDSLMLDWSPSEFSRIRLQYARDRARPGPADGQWFLQYQMSLGAHGAHSY
ncbi:MULTISPECIES: hypothetical protein [Ramlibacter]|uniref:TonB-dependent receptor n=1 Tax=Ramlibacter aquaticus TaxID=2780094 RepID=A0ABR9SHS6_9BURK|nr:MULTISPECIES: hypothetical protein [Ramlibacter]MBE7941729.1 hypothetical protein [Ramlibacter aquaticus]